MATIQPCMPRCLVQYLLSTYKCDIQETADYSTEQEMFHVPVREIFTAPQLSAAKILLTCRILFPQTQCFALKVSNIT